MIRISWAGCGATSDSDVETKGEHLRFLLPTLPSIEDLRLLRMRHAIRSSEAVSAMLAAALLWPLLLVLVGVVIAIFSSARADLLRALGIGVPVLVALLVIGLALWFTLDQFFSTAGRTVSIVSFLLYLLFIILFYRLSRQLFAMKPGFGDIRITFGIAFTLATASVWWWHAVRLWLLEKDERIVVASYLPGEPLKARLAASLTTWRHSRQSHGSLGVPILLMSAKMIQSLSAYLSFFGFGVLLFNASILPLCGLDIARGKESLSFNGSIILAIIGVLSLIVLVSFSLTQFAMALKRIARRLSRHSFARIVNLDTRPPILFLRSFIDDQVTLPRLPIHTAYWLAEPHPRRLDHVLVERFSYLGPVVAVGRPGETDLPFGAARLFVPDEAWQPTIREIAARALGIVIVVDDSPGVSWETQCMLERDLAEKTLFLASPRSGCPELSSHSALDALLTDYKSNYKGFRTLAAYRELGRWRTLASRSPAADDYIVACQAFFKRQQKKVAERLHPNLERIP